MINSTKLNTFIFAILAAFTLALAVEEPLGAKSEHPSSRPSTDKIPLSTSNETCHLTHTKPNPEVQKYHVMEPNSSRVCIVSQFAAYLTVGEKKYIELKNGQVNTSASICEPVKNQTTLTSRIVIDFECGSLDIEVKHEASTTYVRAITGSYKSNAEVHAFANATPMFFVNESGHYYVCNSEQSVPVEKEQILVLSNFAVEAFRNTSGTEFYQIPEECPLDSQPVSDLVRVGVGICLVALVAIVLIAYFIGRRRWSERSSYESV